VRHDPHVDFSVECGSTNTRDRPRPHYHHRVTDKSTTKEKNLHGIRSAGRSIHIDVDVHVH
jgi:hypothetical protein